MRTCPQCRRRYADGEAFCPYDGARLKDAAPDPTREMEGLDPLIGVRLDDRYELQRLLGKGGMGTVYAARQIAIQKRVAVKVLRAVDDGGQAMGRFEREARSASKLGHAHIVDIFDFGRTPSPLGGPDALAYLVMELLDGEDLGARLERGPLPLERALPIIIQCCGALGAAHAAGIVHRDLKPENIFLIVDPASGNPDFVKIVDFGLAKITETEMDGEPGRKLTQTGMVFGTPHYMPPEQCMGQPTDGRADVYSLGVILYEALAGKPPFDGSTFMEVINQHLIDPPPPLVELNPAVKVPPGVEAAIRHAMQKLAEDRPASMRAFADELVAALVATPWEALGEQLRPRLAAIPGGREPEDIRPDAFAQTPAVHAVVELDAASLARVSQEPIALTKPKAKPRPDAEPASAEKVIPATRRAIEPVPPAQGRESPSSAPPRPRFSGAAAEPALGAPRAPSLHSDDDSVPAPPVAASNRALGWVLGAVLLLLLGGALGYGALLLAG